MTTDLNTFIKDSKRYLEYFVNKYKKGEISIQRLNQEVRDLIYIMVDALINEFKKPIKETILYLYDVTYPLNKVNINIFKGNNLNYVISTINEVTKVNKNKIVEILRETIEEKAKEKKGLLSKVPSWVFLVSGLTVAGIIIGTIIYTEIKK